MAERWITDASPLISLAKVGQAGLLEALADDLVIPRAVVGEVLEGPPEDPGRRLVESGFGRRLSPGALSPRALAWGLGRGEIEVLSLAVEQQGSTALLDDAAARRCAAALGVPVIGTLGVVVRAKYLGKIAAVKPILLALREAGFYLDTRTLEAVVADVGE